MAADNNDKSNSEETPRPARPRATRKTPVVTLDLAAQPAATPAAATPKAPPPPPPRPPVAASTAPRAAAAAPLASVSSATDMPPPGARREPPPTAAPTAANSSRAGVMPPVSPRRSGASGAMVGGVVGGVVALVAFFLLQSTGIVPSPGRADAERALTQAAALRADLDALRAQPAVASADFGLVQERVTSLEARNAAIADIEQRLTALTTRVSQPAAPVLPGPAAQQLQTLVADVAQLKTRFEALAAAPAAPAADPAAAGATSAAMAALEGRVTAIEAARTADAQPAAPVADPAVGQLRAALTLLSDRAQNDAAVLDEVAAKANALDIRLAALEQGAGQRSETDNAARAIAVAALRDAAEKGEPIAGPLAVIGQFDIAADMLAPLAAVSDGVPTKASVIAGFTTVADAMLAAGRAPAADAGLMERLFGGARNLVDVRPVGPIEGATTVAIVSRMEERVAAGDFSAALRERNGLPSVEQAISATWAADAARRLFLDRQVAAIADALTKPPVVEAAVAPEVVGGGTPAPAAAAPPDPAAAAVPAAPPP